MTLTELRYITAVARERHFGRAAAACFVSQPTLSVAVRKLEDELGVRLFERNAAEVTVTPAGEPIIAQALRVLEEVEVIRQLAEQGKDQLVGALRLGAIPTIGPYLFPDLIPNLHELAPDMPLFVEEDVTDVLTDKLKQGQLDVIVISSPYEEPGVVTLPLYEEPFVVLLPVSLVFLGWGFSQKPSHDRAWEADFQQLPKVNLVGDTITIEHVRNTEYRAIGDSTTKYETRSYRLSQLQGVDALILFWGSSWMCHPMFIFDFGPDGRVCISIEVRYRVGQEYSFFRSLHTFVKKLMPRYIREGKAYLNIAIGCTGGRHRSVAVTRRLAKELEDDRWAITVSHRDKEK